MPVRSLMYSLDTLCPIPWTASAESQLHQDYPFLNQGDTDEDYVIRRYLETLWLPESFNSLTHLVVSLRRIAATTDDTKLLPHPLHSLLKPLILSSRASSDKYRTELVQILANGGGACEQEEMMMWYAWEYEKADGETDEETWRKEWLERLERREAMIQILLTMLKFSLPGPSTPTKSNHSSKRKKRTKQIPSSETDEGRLESYMDKLAVWQLTETMDEFASTAATMGSSQGKAKADRHWTQVFCEDVVEPLFKTELPNQCSLLRSKVFPTSPFSDADDSDAETLLNSGKSSRAGSRARSLSRKPTLSRLPSVAPDAGVSSLNRNRSRSLSITLAQDEASQRASFIEPKRALSREVSMSRVFKEKHKQKPKPRPREEPKPAKPKPKRDMGTTLVKDTPMLARVATQSGLERQDSAPIFTLSPLSLLSSTDVEDAVCSTPAKPGARSGKMEILSTQYRKSTSGAFENEVGAWLDENADDSFTSSFGSPDVLLLDEGGHNGARKPISPSPTLRACGAGAGNTGQSTRHMSMRMADVEDEYAMNIETPTRKRVRRT
ncbi:hypothetical protein EW145_g4980 [Phellinidium pouzarii]|uniref:DNA replication regulator Sld3 C-terminal domain-containing protein n=1 Tax=Phellinidium pouzarii TaxID=167371 RepID=A0A4S4L1N7_9AGAM|nr:hypothetical protein EW145_g4980 [Phellinidium pouzarii]